MIGAALLAAGGSTRLGRPKQLLLRAGVPLVRHVVSQLMAADIDAVAVVLGCEAERIADALEDGGSVRYQRLNNAAWAEGMASSIRCAVDWAAAAGCDALLLAACDQPHLTAQHLNRLCSTYRATGDAVTSGYAGVRGIPALFPVAWFPRLLELEGDRGAGRLLREAAVGVIPWPEGEIDIDTHGDVLRAGLAGDP